jgi:hypothetical protein
MVQQDSFLNPRIKNIPILPKKWMIIINWDEFQLGLSPLEVQ